MTRADRTPYAGVDKADDRICWRCGVDFDGQYHYHSDAPCIDCRDFLAAVDGDVTIWRGSPLTRAEKRDRAALEEQALRLLDQGRPPRAVCKELHIPYAAVARLATIRLSRELVAA